MKICAALFLVVVSLVSFSVPLYASGHGHKTLSVDSIPVHYAVEGEGKPALVFVHCWCCDKSYWKYQVPHFAKRYTVVTLDLAGHGESGMGRDNWTVEAFGADVVTVVEALDLERVVLIGHSMGGPVILEAARRIPGRVIGIVGVDTYQNLESELPEQQRAQFLSPFKADFPGMTENFVRMMFPAGADTALVNWVAADMSSAPSEVGIAAMENMLKFKPREALGEITVPIYSINSDKFPTNVEAGKRSARSFEVKFMPGRGHFVQMEDPEEFNRLLGEIIDELEKQ